MSRSVGVLNSLRTAGTLRFAERPASADFRPTLWKRLSVKLKPSWHFEQFALPVKRSKPRLAESLTARLSPLRQRSNGDSLAGSVARAGRRYGSAFAAAGAKARTTALATTASAVAASGLQVFTGSLPWDPDEQGRRDGLAKRDAVLRNRQASSGA